MFALADCNNFYASCQRVFQPALDDKPIVVLSNNDGCIIARSNEAKALGIPMGAPTHQWQNMLRQHKVHIFSSNYALYGDMSARVMNSLARLHGNVEIYSIDEAFMRFSGLQVSEMHDHAQMLCTTVKQWTGMPISIGVAPTKTLAKLANNAVKKSPHLQHALVLGSMADAMPYLEKTAIGNVWGVGRRWAERLQQDGFRTAADLARSDSSWIRKRYDVVLQRTAMELAGMPCLDTEIPTERQQILVSRSFRPKITDYQSLSRALAGYISRAAEKLRGQGSLCKNLTVFIHTNPHQDDFYRNTKSINLSQYTADTATLLRAGRWGLKTIYCDGLAYSKAGVMFNDLIPEKNQQLSLFNKKTYDEQSRKRMQLLDAVNQRFGTTTLGFASEPIQRWSMYRQHLSPSYTTRWDELLEVD